MLKHFLQGSKSKILAAAALLVVIIALIDWKIQRNLTLGVLYLFPILLLGTVLKRWHVLIAVSGCTFLCDYFAPHPTSLPQDILLFAGLLGSGLFAHEAAANRRQQAEHLRETEAEITARRDAEEQLEFLIESSPAAIITMERQGRILRANSAAHRLLGLAHGQLRERQMARYLPALEHTSAFAAPQSFRTQMQCKGKRENGEMFLANVYFSSYRTAAGPRLAAFVVDASDELRDREEVSLQQMLAGSRIMAHAVSHEIRNLCGAISLVHENLRRTSLLEDNKDFGALGSLVDALNKIASLELRQTNSRLKVGPIDLSEALDEFRIVLEMSCQEAGIAVDWNVPEQLPAVWADRHSLLQVLLNLLKNSERALAQSANKVITFSADDTEMSVLVRLSDSGPGISSLDKLFQPFQQGADSTGLGLYLSRALMRSFQGDLRYEPRTSGCCFAIEIAKPVTIFKNAGIGQNESNTPAIA